MFYILMFIGFLFAIKTFGSAAIVYAFITLLTISFIRGFWYSKYRKKLPVKALSIDDIRGYVNSLVVGFMIVLINGISAIIFFHIVVNIGMVMGIMPVTGLPLLLMSYGGTSFLFTFAMLGIVQSINIYRE